MHLSDHSLRQIDDAYIQSLDSEALRGLSLRLLADLKEARERLNQGPTNSSRPPSSRAPWERGATVAEPDEAEAPSPVAAEPVEAPPALTSVGFFMSHIRAPVMISCQGRWAGRARVLGNRGR